MTYYEILMWIQERVLEISQGWNCLHITYLNDDGERKISTGYSNLINFVLHYNELDLVA